jgi:hypothetical protein
MVDILRQIMWLEISLAWIEMIFGSRIWLVLIVMEFELIVSERRIIIIFNIDVVLVLS